MLKKVRLKKTCSHVGIEYGWNVNE
jgi:hypothetical protein